MELIRFLGDVGFLCALASIFGYRMIPKLRAAAELSPHPLVILSYWLNYLGCWINGIAFVVLVFLKLLKLYA